MENLKLLSINEAKKQLGIRRDSLLKLVEERKLISKKIGKRIYIPMQSLLKYVNDFEPVPNDNKPSLLETMKSRIKEN